MELLPPIVGDEVFRTAARVSPRKRACVKSRTTKGFLLLYRIWSYFLPPIVAAAFSPEKITDNGSNLMLCVVLATSLLRPLR